MISEIRGLQRNSPGTELESPTSGVATLASKRDDSFATVAMLASVVAAGIAAVYWIARIGFENPVLPIVKALALSMFMTTAPFTIRFVFRMNARPYHWLTSYSFLWILTLVVIAVLGWIVPVAGANAFYLLAPLGVAGFFLVTMRSLRGRSLGEGIGLLVGSAVFSTWTAGVVWGRVYKNPLFFENLAATGNVHHDGLHLAAFANMLRTYGVPSTGLNGLPSIPYHWGTPWLFAQLSNLLDASVLDFYQMAYPITMIPLFFGAVLALASEVSHVRKAEIRERPLHGMWFWGVFLAATIGVIPVEAMDALGVWTSNPVISESYAVAVAVGLLLVACTLVFWRSGAEERLASGERLSASDNVFLAAVLPLGIVALGYLKISLMILGFGLAMYLALRVRLYRRPIGLVAMVLMTLLVAITYPRVSLPAHNEGIALFDFIHGYVPAMWWFFFPVLHLFWSWTYVVLRLIQEKTATLDELWERLKARRLLDVEAVLLVALAGLAPGMILHIDGGSAFYFSDVQRWLALGLLLAMPPLRIIAFNRSEAPPSGGGVRVLGKMRMARVVAAIFALPLIATMARNTAYWPKRFAQENSATRASLYPASLASSIPAGVHGLPYLANSDTLREGLLTSRNFRVVDQLRRLSSMSLAERRRTALFIPQSELRYWDVLTRPGACSFSSFVAPALSAMAMIDGMPPFGCKLSPFYGLGQYAPRRRPQTEADARNLCRIARASGLKQVMTLHFDSAGDMTTRLDDCTIVAFALR